MNTTERDVAVVVAPEIQPLVLADVAEEVAAVTMVDRTVVREGAVSVVVVEPSNDHAVTTQGSQGPAGPPGKSADDDGTDYLFYYSLAKA